MAVLLQPDGTKSAVTPANGRTFTLEEFYALLECKTVEMIHLEDGRLMWVDEHGKFKDDPQPNLRATCLLHKAGGLLWDVVVGRALLCSKMESGEPTDDS